ncbi:MAG: 4Fe-4S dicluster domain-containing protein, partial [Endomicrobiia bacterium]
DLRAKKILDSIFLGGVCIDPQYKFYNENTLIFTSDCPQPASSCWCTFIGGKPYSEEGFDLNFSSVEDGYIVESGSENGEKIITQAQAFFDDVSKEQLSEREKSRKDSIEKLNEINKDIVSIKNIDFQKLYKDSFNSDRWKKLSEKCVQCMGCNNICPSCYCFYLKDVSKENFQKIRYWDACHSTSYARVAGGANPRPKVYERFRNRYECKFNYRMTNFGMFACTGCGRCYDVSPCRIDIRKVTLELTK